MLKYNLMNKKGLVLTMIYFDNAATTKVSEAASAAALRAMQELFANPSAAYRFGVETARELEAARAKLAGFLGVNAQDVIFTSGATEGINHAIKGIMQANGKKCSRILYSAAEHPAVSSTAGYMQQFCGCEADVIPIDSFGRIELDALENLLQIPTQLVCLQLVNNELGIIQPVREAAELAHRYGAYILVDGVQAFGKIPCKISDLQADAFVLSGHKLHAPKGIGALWLSPKLHCREFIQGGGQEKKRRSGTENMPGILALAAAAEEAFANAGKRKDQYEAVRNTLLQYIEENIPDIRVNTDIKNSAPHILNISFAGTKSEVLLHYLEQQGICVSAGSACSTHKNAMSGKNQLLVNCGLEDKWTTSCLRFSFSAENTTEEALQVGKCLKAAVEEIRLLML